jgi:hypothetical protein
MVPFLADLIEHRMHVHEEQAVCRVVSGKLIDSLRPSSSLVEALPPFPQQPLQSRARVPDSFRMSPQQSSQKVAAFRYLFEARLSRLSLRERAQVFQCPKNCTLKKSGSACGQIGEEYPHSSTLGPRIGKMIVGMRQSHLLGERAFSWLDQMDNL